LFDAEKNEQRHPVSRVDDIYRFSDELIDAARRYLEVSDKPAPEAEDEA
jgi:hypothetical protein